MQGQGWSGRRRDHPAGGGSGPGKRCWCLRLAAVGVCEEPPAAWKAAGRQIGVHWVEAVPERPASKLMCRFLAGGGRGWSCCHWSLRRAEEGAGRVGLLQAGRSGTGHATWQVLLICCGEQFFKPDQHLGELDLSLGSPTQQEVVQPASFAAYIICQSMRHLFVHSSTTEPCRHCAASGMR